MVFKRFFLLVAVATAPLAASAQFEGCREYFPNGVTPQPVQRPRLKDLCFDSFAVLHSGESKTPVWVVERLNRERLAAAQGEERTNRFYEEARLPLADRATLDDYRGSGFDRGHMAPAGDMPTAAAMAQSFSLANMVPQVPENNRGVWAHRVEAATRQYVQRAEGDVYVFTGPVFEGVPRTIGRGLVWVPTNLFKLVYDSTTKQAWAFWVENAAAAPVQRPMAYRDLVNRLGFELLPGLPVKD